MSPESAGGLGSWLVSELPDFRNQCWPEHHPMVCCIGNGDPAGRPGDNQVSLSCRIEFRRTGQPDSTGKKQTAEHKPAPLEATGTPTYNVLAGLPQLNPLAALPSHDRREPDPT